MNTPENMRAIGDLSERLKRNPAIDLIVLFQHPPQTDGEGSQDAWYGLFAGTSGQYVDYVAADPSIRKCLDLYGKDLPISVGAAPSSWVRNPESAPRGVGDAFPDQVPIYQSIGKGLVLFDRNNRQD